MSSSTNRPSLGITDPGTSQVIGGKRWTLVRSTWDMQIKWGRWYAERVESSVMRTAEAYRKKARSLWRDVERYNAELYADELPNEARNVELCALVDDASREARFLEEEARTIIREFNDRDGAGEFEYTGNAGLSKALQNLPGQFYLAWLCLQPKHPGITLDEVTQAYKGHAQEWGQFLVRSEGAQTKKPDAPAGAASTSPSTDTSTESKSPSTPTSPQPDTPAPPAPQ